MLIEISVASSFAEVLATSITRPHNGSSTESKLVLVRPMA
jgi:hypothetical protein